MNAKVGDRFVIEVDVEGGLPLSTKVRHVTEGDIGLELDEPNRRWVRWVIERGGEQRGSPRQDRRLLAWVRVEDGVLGMWTADISCSGAYLLSHSSFELGEVLELELVDDTNATLRLRCRVIRRGAPGIGVRFIDLDDERRSLLEDLLQAA